MSAHDAGLQRLVPVQSLVLVVDVQERLSAAMPADAYASFVRNIEVLLDASVVLGVRVAATEQYPKGLGPTVRTLAERLASSGARVDEKLTFSAAAAAGVVSAVGSGATTVVVVGMEAHVCVYQTVRDLRQRGVAVHVVGDAVISRKAGDRATGLALCERAGAVLTSTETVIFDWLERAGTDAFRAVSKLVR